MLENVFIHVASVAVLHVAETPAEMSRSVAVLHLAETPAEMSRSVAVLHLAEMSRAIPGTQTAFSDNRLLAIIAPVVKARINKAITTTARSKKILFVINVFLIKKDY